MSSTRLARRAARALACGLALGVVLALPLAARAQGREFSGRVVSIGPAQLVVESRRGEQLGFARSKKTAVEGRKGWGGIAPGDRVIVQWQLDEGPREARRVIVLSAPAPEPPAEGDGH